MSRPSARRAEGGRTSRTTRSCGLYSLQQTRLMSEQVLKTSIASSWSWLKIVFSPMPILRSTGRKSSQRRKKEKRKGSNEPRRTMRMSHFISLAVIVSKHFLRRRP